MSTTIRISGPFLLRPPNRDEIRLDPANRESLGLAFVLVRDGLLQALVSEEGALTLRFGSGTELTAAPQPGYEAWGVSLSNGYGATAMPTRGWDSWGESS
jgi:hypothetical protein